MAKVPLTGGAYMAHSVIASAQRSLNLYAEPMPEAQGEPMPAAHYPTPGLRLLGSIGTGPIRGIRQCTTGGVYVVSGDTLYNVNTSTWAGTPLGTMTALHTPVSMQDNGLDMVVVDGTANGRIVNLASNAMTAIIDPTGMFAGADRVDYLDTFLIFNKPATPQFYISGSLAVTFDPLDFANKEAYPDLLVTVVVAKRLLYLFGERTTEIWYDAGATDIGAGSFPFAAMQSEVFIDHGCVAKYSPAVYDNSVFWLTRDRQGQGIVMMVSGYQTKRVSTYAIEAEIAGYTRINDAIGFTYQLAGHTFYVLTFPHADHTWCYDIATGHWHEWAWIDVNGDEHRHRANCFWPVNDTPVVGDWQNGNLYALDNQVFTDNGSPIKRVRSFPHMLADGKRVFYRQFLADFETGNAPEIPVTVIIPPSPSGFHMLPLLAHPQGAAYAVSADGHVTVGYVVPSGGGSNNRLACYWTDTTGPVTIGTDMSEAWGASADGSVIVGVIRPAGAGTQENAFRWTAAGGLVIIDTLGYASGISADSSRIIGWTSVFGAGGYLQPCFWDSGGTTRTYLPLPSGYLGGQAWAISADGSVIVGEFYPPAGTVSAFRWTAAGGMVDLGFPSGSTANEGHAEGVSDDGNTVIGFFRHPVGGTTSFIWTPTSYVEIFDTSGIYGFNAISGDGSTIYGYGWYPDVDHDLGSHIAYMVAGAVTTPTPTLFPGGEPSASYFPNPGAISHNGKVMVGYCGATLPFIYYVPQPARITIPVASNSLISLDWSDDRGHHYGSPVTQPIGAAGEYRTSIQYQRLGMARDRVFRLSWSVPMKTALQGAWIDAAPASS